MKAAFFSLYTVIIVLVIALVFSCKQSHNYSTKAYSANLSIASDSAAVVSAHPLASQVGLDILKNGGNAIDAAIAVQFALAVVHPRAGNLGGGGFMIVRMADGRIDALDYREKAPAAAFPEMYLDSLGNVIDGLSQKGALSVAVPGTVYGMYEAYKKYGQIGDWSQLILPSEKLARFGFKISLSEADRLNRYKKDFLDFKVSDRHPFIVDNSWKEGDLLIQNHLAKTLAEIRKKNVNGFYRGFVAEKTVDIIQKFGGIVTLEDLKNYKSVWRNPIVSYYDSLTIIGMPPPSSGGITMSQILTSLSADSLNTIGPYDTHNVHLFAEASRRAYADRAEFLGDTDFVNVPVQQLISNEYINKKMESYDPNMATPSAMLSEYKVNILPESFETTHTCVVDQEKNAVSITTTLNLNYGSKIWVDGVGFFLNDEMDDFSAKQGVPNFFGLVGSEANKIQANKRMLSSMSPTIVLNKDKLYLVVGSPGGSTIITSVAQVILNNYKYNISLEKSISNPRYHHQWLPDAILYESNAPIDTLALQQLQHKTQIVNKIGLVKAIKITPEGRIIASGDKRNPDDTALGF